MLPAALRQQIEAHLPAPIQRIHPVSGGDISRAVRVETAGTSWLIKWRDAAPADFFAAEADGLATLRAAKVLPVPQVLAHTTHFIILEWWHQQRRYDAAQLGHGLAGLHALTAAQYGYQRANFIGALAQSNTPTADWPTFWREQRLLPQIRLAAEAQRLTPARARGLERLADRLTELLSHQPAPALLHGDLWAGNVISAPDGRPALIDPAVSYGDRETDLAFASLFGGFDERFYAAYAAAAPLPADAAERRPLYQLYWLLVHLNLFGESYGPAVDRVIDRYQ
jgi:fructosamine-3-kinase